MTRRQDDWLPRSKGVAAGKAAVVAVLDIGSIKITCVIARLKPQGKEQEARSHAIEVLGVGHQRATGMKRGAIVDMEATERSIRLAVDAAERMAGVTVASVIVNLGAGRLNSQNFSACVDVVGPEVKEGDVRRGLEAGRAHSIQSSRVALHALPIAFSLDGAGGIRDPRGMAGHELGVDMHLVTAEAAPARNLVLCVERCHLTVEAVVASPYAAGLGAMVGDESELGSAVIDMGGGTTTYGIFAHGRFVYSDGVAIGGHHITMDLARGLSTSLEAAERIKTLYGSALGAGSFHGDGISVPLVGEVEGAGGSHLVSRAQITEIVRPRVEEILELLRERFRATPFSGLAGGRAVLTGGASQLPGMVELAERILGLKIRIGRPVGVKNLPDAAKGPAFAVTAGLLAYPLVANVEHHRRGAGGAHAGTSGGYLARVGNWIRESF
ncbi:cell division protein FtsA [Lutibaculum baratangense]|uniref:Cell division protein FtsA n=1 Tax=Lutibaculum baratangense AMV1 TaxID=631454 RepID=V4RMS3_9HYPH|nr:cell division protein FtsA [Lutibaculum baratangense]ESR27326.1 Cell division protein FtsA [Lutibaculum baratangense AMV1]